MVYLENITSGQTVWIPKNDVDEAFVPHTYSEGYKDGIEYQKSLLSSTAFTENGEYSKEDGWSAVTVNVPTGSTAVLEEKTVVISADTTNVLPSSGYDGMSAVTIDATGYAQQNYDDGFDDGFLDGMSSGYTDGFESGYTSGETHQKSLLVSTAFTENGTYTREDGWNEVEVNYDSGSTYQSGYTSGYTDGYDSGYTSGHTDGEDAIISTFSSMTATTNGEYGSSASPLSSITVNVPTGVSIPLTSITINSNTAITVSDKAYTGITVDVPLVYFDEYIHTNPLHSTNLLDYLIDTNIIPTTGTTMRVKGMNMGIWNGETIVGSDEPPYPSFRGFWTVDNIFYDWNGERINTAWTGNSQTNTGNTIDVTFGNYYIYDNIAEEMLVSGNTIQGWSTNMSIHVDVGSWLLKELEIWDGETKVFDGVAAHNSIGEVGLYDYVSQKMYTNSNINIVYENLTPSIEPNKSFTATSNGEYTIIPSDVWSITYDKTFARRYDFTINGTIPQSEVGELAYTVEYYDENTGEEPSVRIYISGSNVLSIDKSNWEEDDYGDVDFMLWQGKYRLEFDEDLDSSEFTVYHHNTSGKYDAMSAVTLTVDTPTVTLGTASFSANGTYSASTDNLDGYSAITINVPKTGGPVKYVEYIETDGTRVGWDTGLKVGSENSNFNIELDFMPLSGTPNDDAFYTFICDTDNNDRINVFVRTWGGGYHLEKFQVLLGSIYNNSYSGFSSGNRYDLVLDYASNSGSIKSNNVDILPNQSVTLRSRNDVGNICINTWYVNGEVHRCPLARYYKVNIIIDGVEHTFNPCLDENDVPCFYDEYNQTYLYNIGTGNTPTVGPVLPTPDYISGHTQGMKDALENSLYGAYYPVDIATNKSYYTVFPTLEEGQKLFFDIVVFSIQNGSLIGDYQSNLELKMRIGDGADLRVASTTSNTAVTEHTYWTVYNLPNTGTSSVSAQRLCGEVAVTDSNCKHSLDVGCWIEEHTTNGTFSLQYPVVFNQACLSGIVVNSLIYKDASTDETIHHFRFNSSTNEIEDYFNNNTVAPTYDYNGNLVSGVLEPKQFRFLN